MLAPSWINPGTEQQQQQQQQQQRQQHQKSPGESSRQHQTASNTQPRAHSKLAQLFKNCTMPQLEIIQQHQGLSMQHLPAMQKLGSLLQVCLLKQ